MQWNHFNWPKLYQVHFVEWNQNENEDVCSINGLSNTVILSEIQITDQEKQQKPLALRSIHTYRTSLTLQTFNKWGCCCADIHFGCTWTICGLNPVYTYICVVPTNLSSCICKYVASSLKHVSLQSAVSHYSWRGERHIYLKFLSTTKKSSPWYIPCHSHVHNNVLLSSRKTSLLTLAHLIYILKGKK